MLPMILRRQRIAALAHNFIPAINAYVDSGMRRRASGFMRSFKLVALFVNDLTSVLVISHVHLLRETGLD
jgi:hypothetical protein